MSKGMKFLNKKSWHTAKIQNIEQVWVAESKKKDEARKLLELKKQLDEERAVEGLRAVQAQSGLITSAQASRLDWMYTGAPVADAKVQEDYLTGKEKKLDLDKEDVMKLHDKKAAGSLFLREGVNVELEATNRLRDDPMTIIARQEHEARQHVLKNPVQMKQIKAKAELLEKLKKETSKRKKRERRDRDGSDDDKSKKKKKKSKRSRSSSPSDNDHNDKRSSLHSNDNGNGHGSGSGAGSGNDASTPAVAAVAKKYGLIHSSNIAATLTGTRSLLSAPVYVPTHEPSPSTPSSSSSSSQNNNSRESNNNRHNDERRNNNDRNGRSRSRSRDRHRRRSSRSRSNERRHSTASSTSSTRRRSSRSRSRSRDRRGSSRDRRDDHQRDSRPSSAASSSNNNNNSNNNGNNNSSGNNGSSSRRNDEPKKPAYVRQKVTSSKLTAEEMKAKLAAMQSTAKAHDTAAIQRMNDARAADKKEMAEILARGNPDANTAKFVEDMNKKLYTSGEENIEDRLKKYSHYRQKGNTEHHSFMTR